mmetsp:Transcript_9417/g.28655  ORF Transcript_9417/g.28655 Transcript_9417/m.28655 type:complete len:336 (-) Transcript_9417:239-1246(-)
MLATLAAAAAYTLPCRPLRLGERPVELAATAAPSSQPLCVAVDATAGGILSIQLRPAIQSHLVASRLCFSTRWSDGAQEAAASSCADTAGFASWSGPADAGRVYHVLPFLESETDPEIDVIFTAAITRPKAALSAATARNPGLPNGYCAIQRSNLLLRCERPAAVLCPHAETDIDVMNCLSNAATSTERGLINAGCEYAMREWSDCIYGPRLLVPMEIASFLLLAAASVILFCAVVRCCCRLCNRTLPRRELHGSRAESLVDPDSDREADDDTLGEIGLEPLQAAPDPAGSGGGATKMFREAETHASDAGDDDEALPTYSDVVDGAVVVRPHEGP